MNFSVGRPLWAGGLLLIAVGVLYLATLDNGLRPDELTGGDLITHQYAQVEGRPSNAPGYPLYTMGGWLWFRVGRVGLGWALNPIQLLSLYSTLWGVVSLVVLYLILLQVSRWSVAALLTAFYATTYFFWYYSVTTEQYTSAVAQTLLVIWLALRWDDTPQDQTLLWLAFVCGTMLANMVTTLFILPPLLWFIASRQSLWSYFRRPKFTLQAAGVTLLPLVSYAYIYIRGAQHPEWRGAGDWPTTWVWFTQFVTIQQGRDELAPGLSGQSFFTAEFPALMWGELTPLIFFGGLIGLVFLGRRRALFFYGTLAIYFVFCWAYRFGNWFQVIIPAYPLFVIGFAALLSRLGFKPQANSSSRLKADSLAPLLLVAGLLLYRGATNLPRANQRDLPGDTGLEPGWLILADEPHSPAVVVGVFEERVALEYLRAVWGRGEFIAPVETVPATLPPEATLYISRQAVAAGVTWHGYPQAAGEQLIELSPAPRHDVPAGAIPVQLGFGDGLELLAWEPVAANYPLPPRAARPANWQIALYWRAVTQPAADYTVSVRPLAGGALITVDGEPLIQDHQPVWGVYPTGRWTPREVVRDLYALSLPVGVAPEAAQIVLYRATATGFENLGERVIDLRSAGGQR
jgi:hypothetical protein